MNIVAELSLYPLKDGPVPEIIRFIKSMREQQGIDGKTIVLFGAMQPARMRYSDAMYNLGVASAAVQLLPEGIYIAMNGQIFNALQVTKNRAQSRFESIDQPPA